MTITGPLRNRAKRITWLYEAVRRRRAGSQEREYLRLRELYYARMPDCFAEPGGYEPRSRSILASYWPGLRVARPTVADVCLFAVAPTTIGASRPLPELSRNFDCVTYDFGSIAQRVESGDTVLRAHLQKEILEAFHTAQAKKPFDIAWFSATNTFVAPHTLQEIRRAGVPVVVLNLDEKHLFLERRLGYPNGQKPLIGSVDVHLTNSLECVRWFMAEGAAAYFFPQGVDPEWARPMAAEKKYDVSFLGAAYGVRRRFIESLQLQGIKVACFGRNWGTRFVSDDEKIEIFNQSVINLGMGGTGHSERQTCIKGRDIEVPGSGNLLLTTYDCELARLWAIGKEVLCYYNEIDAAEQIRYYLSRPHEVAALGQAARQRALLEHTWTRRMEDLLRWMGILAPAA
jgi:hypothetical protein